MSGTGQRSKHESASCRRVHIIIDDTSSKHFIAVHNDYADFQHKKYLNIALVHQSGPKRKQSRIARLDLMKRPRRNFMYSSKERLGRNAILKNFMILLTESCYISK